MTGLKTTYALIIILLLWGSWIASRWLMADIAINNVKREFESWNEQGVVSSISIWASTRSELERAKSLNPNEPEYYRLEGLLYEWRFFVEALPYSSTEVFLLMGNFLRQ